MLSFAIACVLGLAPAAPPEAPATTGDAGTPPAAGEHPRAPTEPTRPRAEPSPEPRDPSPTSPGDPAKPTPDAPQPDTPATDVPAPDDAAADTDGGEPEPRERPRPRVQTVPSFIPLSFPVPVMPEPPEPPDVGRDAEIERDDHGEAPEVGIAPEPPPAPAPEPEPVFEPPKLSWPAELEHTDEPEVASEDRPLFAIKALVGLVGLLVLAYLGGHPGVQRLERRLGISRVVAAGFPFLALGLLAHRNEVLSDAMLDHLRPVLHLALGWIGLVIGMRIELGKLSALPRGAVTIVGIGTGIPLAAILAGCAAVLLGARALAGEPLMDPTIVRDALILGAAGAIAADTETLRYGARKASWAARRRLVLLANLDELAALVGLAFLNAYFRPSGVGVTWQLPNTAWVFVTFGLGLVVGVVVYAIARLPATRTESVALLLGSVAFTAGIASELHLSPLVVCFIVGLLLTNFPGDYKARLSDNLARLEMPIYLVFLIVAGAMWRPTLLGWLVMLVLLAMRYAGRYVGGRVVWNRVDAELPSDARRSLVFAPMGTLPIAVAVNAALLYPDGEISTILTATIGGAILCEIALALLWRREELAESAAPSGPGVRT